jgi:signal transduction histidine kinase
MHSFAEQVKLGDAAMAASRAKSDFLAAMSHELRTPLNAIVGHGGLIAETATAAQRESVSEVRRAADSLLAMISDILDYASLDAGHMALHRKPARIALLVNEVHKLMVGDAAAKKLSFEVEVDPACPAWLMLDATLVKQVLRHLVINAIKFTSIGGVRLQVRLEKGNLLHFIVHDSGCGVSEENRARLFELFSMGDASTTREHGGTGIGLAICKRLCDGMKGRIWLARTGAGGSEFHVELPTEVVPEPGKVWLVTKDSLTSILVSSVAMKQGRAIEVVDDVHRVAASDQDVVLVDAATVNAEGVKARCVVALNAEGVLTAPPTGFAEVLTAPLKPADVKRLLELTC